MVGLTSGEVEGLSAEARQRLERPAPRPLRPPPLGRLDEVARWRAEMHRQWLDGDPAPDACGHHDVVVGGVNCLRGAMTGGGSQVAGPTVVYFHGGGYVLGSPAVAVPITERLLPYAEVVSVDYRLAPEHPYPAAVEDGLAVYRELVASAGGPLVLAGDSAGSNIALTVAIRVLAAGGREPDGLVLFSPHLGPRSPETDASARFDPCSDVDAEAGQWLWDAYRGPRAADDGRLSPLAADLTGLPPMLVQAGSLDGGLVDGRRLVDRAQRVGVNATLDTWPGLWHAWHYHRELPEAGRALERAGAFVAGLAG